MNVLITGATGFIGTYLTKALCNQGFQCRCLVRNIDKAEKTFGNCRRVELVIGDVTEPDSLNNIAENIDVVFNLAALTGHDLPSEHAFKKYRSINVEGVRNILEVCKKEKNIKRIIHVSSTAVYGKLNQHLIDENTICNPITPYQVSKYEGEQLALSYYKEYKMPIVVLRPSMIYGPESTGDLLTMVRIAQKGVYPKFGLGKNLTPALYIDDLIVAMMSSIKNGKIGNVYLIVSKKSYSQAEICDIFEKYFQRKIQTVFIPIIVAKYCALLQERIFEILCLRPIVTSRNILSATYDRIFDISKACKELKFEPKIGLHCGLVKTLRWYKQVRLI